MNGRFSVFKKWYLSLFFLVLLTFNLQLSTCNRIYAAVSETTSYLTVSSAIIPADGATVCTITVIVKSETGALLQGSQVTVTSSRGTPTDNINMISNISDANGRCTATISSSTGGGDTIYAQCEGATITQNLVPNCSFEEGSNTDALNWTGEDTYYRIRDTTRAHSGDYSMRISYIWQGTSSSALPSIVAGSTYRFSVWCYNLVDTGFAAVMDIIPDAGGSGDVSFTRNLNQWEYKETTWTGDTSTARQARCYTGNAGMTGTAWFDDFRLKRIPTIHFLKATKFVFTSSAFTMTKGNPSSQITVEARDDAGYKDNYFNETVALEASSPYSKFSLSSTTWVDTTIITMKAGVAGFYYKDTQTGNPIITISRSGLSSCTQTENIIEPLFHGGNSLITPRQLSVNATGTDSITALVTLYDSYGYLVGAGKSVVLSSNRGNSDTISSNPQISDDISHCTWTISSGYAGEALLGAAADGTTTYILGDDFSTYAEGSNASPLWTYGSGVCKVESGEYSIETGSAYVGNTNWTNYTIETKMKTIVPGPFSYSVGRIAFRYLDGTRFYELLLYTDGNIGVWRQYGSSWTNPTGLVATGKSPTDWHTFRIVVSGSNPVNMKVYLDSDTSPKIDYNDSSNSQILQGRARLSTADCDAHYDNVKFPNFSKVNFSPTRLKITTSAFSITTGNPSPAIVAEVWGNLAGRDTSDSQSINLSTSSATGKFSLSKTTWVDTSTISLYAGSRAFYYKDSNPGNPIITASRSGLTSDSQVVSIFEPGVNETASYITFTPYQILADGTSLCSATVTINDTYGYPIANKLATLQTTNGNSDTINDSIGGTSNTQTTDVNGQCTWTIKSIYAGWDTITASSEGKTITRGVNKYGAVGIWHFDNDVNDVSGSGYNGTLYNDPAWTSAYDSAAQGCALRFDGVNDYVDMGNVLNMGVNQSFTVTAWVNVETIPGSVWGHGIATKGGFGWLKGYALLIRGNADGTRKGQAEFSIMTGGSGNGVELFGGSNLQNTGWHYLVGSRNSQTNEIKLYVDGVAVSSTTNATYADTDLTTGVYNFQIGNEPTAGSQFFKGIIDEVRIYNRALTDTEVKQEHSLAAVLEFTSVTTRLKITSSSFSVGQGIPSSAITVEAQDAQGSKTTLFGETISLTTSSNSGVFSVASGDWINTTIITMQNGSATFYYKDSYTGNPTMTVSRSGLTSDAQVETIVQTVPWDTHCYLTANTRTIPANGISSCSITVTIRDINGNLLPGKQVTIYSVRGDSDVIAQPGLTDSNGQCTGSVTSIYSGSDTIYTVCEGGPIWENVVPNPSFELGSDTNAYNWATEDTGKMRITDRVHTGNYSVRMAYVWASLQSDQFSINQYSTYEVSGWMYDSSTDGSRYIDLSDVANDIALVPPAKDNWEYVKANWYSDTYTSLRMRTVVGPSGGSNPLQGTVWFDDFRIRRVPTITFSAVAAKLVITSAPFTATQNIPAAFTIQAQDNSGEKDTTFNNTVTLASSSLGGKFSVASGDWTDTSVVYLSSGELTLYYKDANLGNPTITVSRTGLVSGSQSETIITAVINETYSYIILNSNQVKGDGTSVCTAVVVLIDSTGAPIPGKNISLHSSRGNSDTINTNPQITDSSGQCTFTISSAYTGNCTITADCEGKVISRGFDRQSLNGAWLFNEIGGNTAVDISGKGNNGTISGATRTTGPLGPCLSFNGSSNYVSVPSSTSLEIQDKITIDFWMKVNVYSAFVRLFGKSPYPDYDYFILLGNTGASQIGFRFKIGGVEKGVYSGNNAIDAASWHHIVSVYDSSTGISSLYINGQSAGSSSSTGNIDVHNTGALNIGRDPNGSAYFTGLIDEVKIYNRVLTDTEVKRNYSLATVITFIPSAAKLKIASSPFTAGQNSPSSAITVEAQDNQGNKDTLFGETISLITSSNSGVFSVNKDSWANTTVITMQSGSATFYYKDGKIGNSTITVSRAGLTSDAQVETIVAQVFSETYSSLSLPSSSSVKANLSETCTVTVTVKDANNSPITGKSVSLATARGGNSTTIAVNPQISDSNGQCTFTVSSGYFGTDTFSAVYEGKSFNHLFSDDFSVYLEGSNASPPWASLSGTWKVESGEYSGETSALAYIGNSDWKDYTIEVRMKTVSAGTNNWDVGNIVFRYSDSTHFYQLLMYNDAGGSVAVWRQYGSSWTSPTGLKPSNKSPLDWHNYKIVVSGQNPVNMKVYVDGEEIWTLGYNDSSDSRVLAGKSRLAVSGNSHVHFDNVKIYPSTLNFTTGKVGFLSSAFKVKGGSASPLISVYAGGKLGGVDTSFNNTATLSTSSDSGSFSTTADPWNPVNVITLSSGQGTVYYKDSKSGNPTITVSRSDLWLEAGTQTETIAPAAISFASTAFTISTTDSAQLRIYTYQATGETDTTFNDWIVLSTTSSKGKFSISNTTWQDTTTLRFNSGQSTFYYRDKRTGYPSITVMNSELNLSASQTETVTIPAITTSKQMTNERTQVSGILVPVTTGDTIEFTITITNSGLENAINVIVADTQAFDTSVYSTLVFVSMDTAAYADTWTYAVNSAGNWQVWGSVPNAGDENVKGLKWKINAIPAGEDKVIRFRMRVK